MVLTAATNSHVTELCIDKNWKLEDWIDKIESSRTEMKKMWKLKSHFYIFAYFSWKLGSNEVGNATVL